MPTLTTARALRVLVALAACLGCLSVSHCEAAEPGPHPAAISSFAALPGHVEAGPSRTACVTAGLTTSLPAMERATTRRFNCVETFNTEPPNWKTWSTPWFTLPQYGFTRWVAAHPASRTVVISQDLIPRNAGKHWRAKEARGDFNGHARALARTLVAAGFGNSVIRLAHEMNGTWYQDNIGTSRHARTMWRDAWRQVVTAMRSVPGAHFLFDFNVNAGYLPVPLSQYYPGDRYVDIVGVDAYDLASVGPKASRHNLKARWRTVSGEPNGLSAIASFARAHHKAMSIPEWGLMSSADPLGAGDDPVYVRHIGAFVNHHDVAYQSYFISANYPNVLPIYATHAHKSLKAYRLAFG